MYLKIKDQHSTQVEVSKSVPQWNMNIDDFELLTVIGRGSYAKGKFVHYLVIAYVIF